GLRGFWPARPARLRLVSGSCSSARSFAPRFLHAALAVRRSAVRFVRRDQLTRGLSPPSQCPCRAHQQKGPPPPGAALTNAAPQLFVEHDLSRKPVSTPDHVRGRLFGIMLWSRR